MVQVYNPTFTTGLLAAAGCPSHMLFTTHKSTARPTAGPSARPCLCTVSRTEPHQHGHPWLQGIHKILQPVLT
jgi:hypothetical protein